jgi:citrate synthase
VLARAQPLEAVWHLVQRGHLRDAGELRSFSDEAASHRRLDSSVLDALPAFARMGTVMSALRTALSLAGQNARL